MDQLKSLANKFGSKGSGNNAGTAPIGGGAPVAGSSGQGAAPKEDFLDKGVSAVGKKFGYTGNRETNEKVTDFARQKFEGASGKKVPEKFSN